MGLNMPPWQQSAAVAHSLALYCYLASAALCRTPPAREEAEMTLELTLAPSGAAVATPRHRLAPHFYPAPFQILPLTVYKDTRTRQASVAGQMPNKAPVPKLEGPNSPGYQRDRTVGPGEPQRHRI